PGNVVYIPENMPHWYKNVGNEDVEFLCLIPKRKEYHIEKVE
ncbi:MAG: cupin domain-containing protein, partial [Methanomicrobia archaeon]|nr:cupin domain-containing protein [Methanomicrobia archaeon]